MDQSDAALASTELRRLLDEQAVRDACMRYWAGFDRRDVAVYREAFTPDATLSLFGGERVVPVADMLASGSVGGQFEHTCHAPASQVVEVDGDRATADTFVVAHLVPEEGPILVRGLRYRDELVRTEQGWRIRLREHMTLWQYDVERVEPHLPVTGP